MGDLTFQEHNLEGVIFVVEDDVEIGALIEHIIHFSTPYRVVLAANSSQALQMLQHIKPNLFILDYYLPGMNGLELAEQLHTRKDLQGVPTLLMSASVVPQKAGEREINFIQKPFDIDAFLQTIERLLAC